MWALIFTFGSLTFSACHSSNSCLRLKFEVVCLCPRENWCNKASSASRLFGPKLSSACWCWKREILLPLTTVHTHTHTHWAVQTHACMKKPMCIHTHTKFETKSSSPYLAVILTCFISTSHLLLSISLICLCLYQTLSIPISCFWNELSLLTPPLSSSLSCFLAPPYIH